MRGKEPTPDDEALKRLERELYAKDEGQNLIMRRKELSLLGKRIASPQKSEAASTPAFEDMMKKRTATRRKWLRFALIPLLLLVVFVAVLLATLRFRASRQVQETQIGIEMRGPADIVADSEVEYTVMIYNQSRVDWNALELVVRLPQGFRLSAAEPAAEGADGETETAREITWQLGNLASGQTREVKVRGSLIAEDGQVVVVEAEATLTPVNFPSGRFSKKALFTTTVTALPIQISMDAAQTSGSGERVRGVIHVRNLGGEPLENAVLSVLPAPGVELALEDQEFSPGYDTLSGTWELAPIPPLSEATRIIVFTAAGQPGEKRPIEVSVGVRDGETVYTQRRFTHVVTVSASELTIEQAYNGSTEPTNVFPEGKLAGEVRYANVGTVGMRSAVVTLQFEGAGIDVETLRLKQGSQGAFDPRTNRITWTSASVPELSVVQPGEKGVLQFDFEILPAAQFPIEGEAAKNTALVGIAAIDSQDLPTPVGQAKKVISDRAVLSIGTQLTLEPMAFYDDGRLGITSTGPVPPQVGQTTTYTVRLRLGSALNDVGETEVVAILPDGVEYTGKTVVSTGSVDFNDRSREVRWSVPLLLGLTGRARPAEELHFQVAVTPGANLREQALPFVSRLFAEGLDTFIEELVRVEGKDLPTTETASPGKGTVE